MKRPAIQLYFGDLLKNPRVMRCSWGARAVLIWTMSVLHDSDEYGSVRWPLDEIAQAIGCPLPLMKEIATKGVLKGSDSHVEAYRWAPSHAGKRGPEVELVAEQDGPLWYSSRMVRDEYKRTNRGIGTRFGTPGKLPTGTPNPTPSGPPSRANGDGKVSGSDPPTPREGDGASASASSSSIDSSESPTVARDPPPGNGSHKNGSQTQRLGPMAWMVDDSACMAKAKAIGVKARPGESFASVRTRIAKAEAEKAQH